MNSSAVRISVLAVAACLLVVALPAPSFAQGGPFQYHSLTPCRLVDTRSTNGPIITDSVVRTFTVQAVCAVPVGAKAVSVNATAIGPNGLGNLTLYPSGIPRPGVATLNYNAGEVALGNGAIVPLGPTATNDLAVFARVLPVGVGTVHLTVDVTGYFQ